MSVSANGTSKVYDSLSYTGGNGVLYSGFVNGETAAVLEGAIVYSGSSQNAINAGTYVITPGNVTSNNYNIAFNSGQLTVSQATLAYTANSIQFNSGGTIPALTGNVTGFLGGDTLLGSTSGTALWTTVAVSTSPAGDYAISGSGLAATNYQFSQAASNANALTVEGVVANNDVPFITVPVVSSGTSTTLTNQFSPTIINNNTADVNSDVSIANDDSSVILMFEDKTKITLVSIPGKGISVEGEIVSINIKPQDNVSLPKSSTEVSVFLQDGKGLTKTIGNVVVKNFGASKLIANPVNTLPVTPTLNKITGEIQFNITDSSGNVISYNATYANNGLIITAKSNIGYQLIQAKSNLILILAMAELQRQKDIDIEDIEIIFFADEK